MVGVATHATQAARGAVVQVGWTPPCEGLPRTGWVRRGFGSSCPAYGVGTLMVSGLAVTQVMPGSIPARHPPDVGFRIGALWPGHVISQGAFGTMLPLPARETECLAPHRNPKSIRTWHSSTVRAGSL